MTDTSKIFATPEADQLAASIAGALIPYFDSNNGDEVQQFGQAVYKMVRSVLAERKRLTSCK